VTELKMISGDLYYNSIIFIQIHLMPEFVLKQKSTKMSQID